jgi:hypothetical protein
MLDAFFWCQKPLTTANLGCLCGYQKHFRGAALRLQSLGLYDDQPSALLPGLILQAMGFMMVALRQDLARLFNSEIAIHCAEYFTNT